jgi:anti-sigma B factor antagonist
MECLTVQKREKFILVQFRQKCSITNANAEEFSKQVLSSFQPGLAVILNCKNLNFIDSAAISMLVHIRKQVTNQGGRLILTNVGDRIRLLLLITRLHKIFEIHESLQAAIQSIGDERNRKIPKVNPYTIHLSVKNAQEYAVLRILKPDSLIMANARSFQKKVEEYIQKKGTVILNTDVLRNIDSEGIAVLIHLKAFSKKQKKRLVMVYKNRVLKQLFELYSLDRLFQHFETEEEALAALFPKAKETPAKTTGREQAKFHYNDLDFLTSMGNVK